MSHCRLHQVLHPNSQAAKAKKEEEEKKREEEDLSRLEKDAVDESSPPKDAGDVKEESQ